MRYLSCRLQICPQQVGGGGGGGFCDMVLMPSPQFFLFFSAVVFTFVDEEYRSQGRHLEFLCIPKW
jgi:hypothetical protein